MKGKIGEIIARPNYACKDTLHRKLEGWVLWRKFNSIKLSSIIIDSLSSVIKLCKLRVHNLVKSKTWGMVFINFYYNVKATTISIANNTYTRPISILKKLSSDFFISVELIFILLIVSILCQKITHTQIPINQSFTKFVKQKMVSFWE